MSNNNKGIEAISSSQKNITPLLTKFIAPQVPNNYFKRENVFKVLLQGLKRRYTLISASDGYGKSSALAYFSKTMKEEGYPVLWFSVGEKDNNPEYFWTQFFYLLENFAETTRNQSSDIALRTTNEELSSQEHAHDSRKLKLANELSAIAGQLNDIILIIDNFELLSEEDLVSEFIDFTALFSSHIHIYLSSRYAFKVSLLKSSHIELLYTNIDEQDLEFTVDETTDFAQQFYGLDLSKDASKLLLEKTGNWPFAINISLEQAQRTGNPLEFLENLNALTEPFNSFFKHNVFEQLPKDIQDFVIKTSILDTLSVQICDYILNENNSEAAISYLFDRNIVQKSYDDYQERYSYRPFFEDWVKHQMTQLLPEQARRLNLLASQWYQGHNDIVKAAKFITHAVNRKDLTRLVASIFPSQPMSTLELYYSQKDIQSFEDVTVQFCLLAAWAYLLLANISDAEFWIYEAKQLSKDSENLQTKVLMQVIHAKKLGLINKFKESLEIVETLLNNKNLTEDTALHIMVLNCAAEAYHQSGNITEAINYYQNIRTLCKHYNFTFIESINEYEFASLYCSLGQLGQATEMSRYTVTSFPVDYPAYASSLALLSYIELLHGNYQESKNHLCASTEHLSENNNLDMYMDVQATMALYYLATSNKTKAHRVIQELKAFAYTSNKSIPRGASARIYFLEALLAYVDNKHYSEILEIRKIFEDFKITSTHYIESAWNILLIVSDSNSDQKDKIEKLSKAIDDTEVSSYKILSIFARLFLAGIWFENHKFAKSFELIKQAVDMALSEQIYLPFIFISQKQRNMFIKYINQVRPEYAQLVFIRSFLQRSSMFEQDDSKDICETVSVLTKREKEILELLQTGFNQQEISQELQVSVSTIKSHLSHIYTKFNVHGQNELLEKTQNLKARCK
ncbi:MAG: LuxR C-terminal-related transcriptional regulator [Coriobacteriia bacterium]|nr:LuxR C-terminal-related transcriptional regulator [Coriobacteriia bacterium]